jgi:N-acetylated-alpha-linked acidic dipeptidase
MANASLLPFDFRSFFKTVNGYVIELTSLIDQMRETTSTENQLIREKLYAYTDDPSLKLLSPSPKEEVPYLNFANLQNVLNDLDKTTNRLSETLGQFHPSGNKEAEINKLLYKAEQKLLWDAGLPRRPWYKHCIYAPGLYTGYGVKTLPGLREAIEQGNWKEAQEQIEIDATVIRRFNDYLVTIINQAQ